MLRSAQDAHQRGLARPFCPSSVHRPGFDRQRHVIERADSGERLGNPTHFGQAGATPSKLCERGHLMAI
jgi:hypothetical protein